MGFRQALTTRSLGFKKEGNRIETETVHASFNPKIHHIEHLLLHEWAVVIEVGLMAQKTVEVVLLRHLVPFPVRRLEMAEQHWSICVALGVIAPDIHIPLRTTFWSPTGTLKPRMERAGVIQHQVHHHLDALRVGSNQDPMKGRQITQLGVDGLEVGDVVTTVLQWRWINRGEPNRFHTQPTEIGQAIGQALQVTDPITIAIGIAAHDQLVDDGTVPPRLLLSHHAGTIPTCTNPDRPRRHPLFRNPSIRTASMALDPTASDGQLLPQRGLSSC